MSETELPPAFRGRRLAVFDLDGTLYRQAPLRRRMAAQLVLHTLKRRDATVLRILRDYRRRREALAEAGMVAFDGPLVDGCARACRVPTDEVRAVIAEWIERRPLPQLAATAVPGAAELFARLGAAGAQVAVWSDYPVRDKLAALGLKADIMFSATDPELNRLKPDPRGLAMIMERAGASAPETLMVGDRADRDGAAARALGVDFLCRSDRARPGTPGAVRDFTAASLAGTGPKDRAGGARS